MLNVSGFHLSLRAQPAHCHGPIFLSIFLLSSYAETLDPWLCLKAQCQTHLCEAFSEVCHVPSLLHALHLLFSMPAIRAASQNPSKLFLASPYSPLALLRLASSRKCHLLIVILRLWQEAGQSWTTNSFCYILWDLGLCA